MGGDRLEEHEVEPPVELPADLGKTRHHLEVKPFVEADRGLVGPVDSPDHHVQTLGGGPLEQRVHEAASDAPIADDSAPSGATATTVASPTPVLRANHSSRSASASGVSVHATVVVGIRALYRPDTATMSPAAPERGQQAGIGDRDGTLAPTVQVEIWSDVVCPWCYVGKRRFEAALAEFAHAEEIEVVFRSFELDPRAPQERVGDYASHLGKKYGMSHDRAIASLNHMTDVGAEDGLELDFARTRSGNTFDAHRVLHFASERGVQPAVKERLLRAFFTEGEPIGERAALARLAGEAGLDESEVADMLSGDRYVEEVRADEAAADELGISGVPFFLIGRKFAVSGAQSTEVFTRALERAWGKASRGPA